MKIKISNIIFILVLGIVLYQQIPVLKNNYAHRDKIILPREVIILNGKNEFMIFPPEKRAIVIFWASWCGPCKIEMARLKESVVSGSIPKDAIFAVNPFENRDEIMKFIKNNNYPFTFIENSALINEIGVKVTPTTVFFDERKITKMASGMSIWGIWEAELFL